jgi:hypothetical protein
MFTAEAIVATTREAASEIAPMDSLFKSLIGSS